MPAQAGTPEETSAPAALPEVTEPRYRGQILLAAVLASSLGFIDTSVTSIAMPAMRATLGASLSQAQWIGNAYLLCLSSLVLVGGALGDRFGVARVFGAGIAVFVAASLGCALAWDPASMIAARAVKGVGAALMVPGSMALIARTYPAAERGRAIGLWASASTITTALGPILGGAILSAGPPEAWRAIFALNLPVGLFAIWLLWRRVKNDPGKPGTPVDITGTVLATLGLGLLAEALTGASPGVRGAWTATAGIASLAAFLLWESRTAHPLVPLRLFRDRGFAFINLATFFIYFALAGVIFYLPMALVSGWGVAEAVVPAVLLPVSILIGLLSAPAGRLADRIGARPMIAGGAGLVALGYAVVALMAPAADIWTGTLPGMILVGLGLGALVAPLSAAVMETATQGETGTASGINNAVARVSGMIAVALLGTLAGLAYAAAGGPDSFGLASAAPGHAAATSAALAIVAWAGAGTAALGAVTAWLGIPARRG